MKTEQDMNITTNYYINDDKKKKKKPSQSDMDTFAEPRTGSVAHFIHRFRFTPALPREAREEIQCWWTAAADSQKKIETETDETTSRSGLHSEQVMAPVTAVTIEDRDLNNTMTIHQSILKCGNEREGHDIDDSLTTSANNNSLFHIERSDIIHNNSICPSNHEDRDDITSNSEFFSPHNNNICLEYHSNVLGKEERSDDLVLNDPSSVSMIDPASSSMETKKSHTNQEDRGMTTGVRGVLPVEEGPEIIKVEGYDTRTGIRPLDHHKFFIENTYRLQKNDNPSPNHPAITIECRNPSYQPEQQLMRSENIDDIIARVKKELCMIQDEEEEEEVSWEESTCSIASSVDRPENDEFEEASSSIIDRLILNDMMIVRDHQSSSSPSSSIELNTKKPKETTTPQQQQQSPMNNVCEKSADAMIIEATDDDIEWIPEARVSPNERILLSRDNDEDREIGSTVARINSLEENKITTVQVDDESKDEETTIGLLDPVNTNISIPPSRIRELDEHSPSQQQIKIFGIMKRRKTIDIDIISTTKEKEIIGELNNAATKERTQPPVVVTSSQHLDESSQRISGGQELDQNDVRRPSPISNIINIKEDTIIENVVSRWLRHEEEEEEPRALSPISSKNSVSPSTSIGHSSSSDSQSHIDGESKSKSNDARTDEGELGRVAVDKSPVNAPSLPISIDNVSPDLSKSKQPIAFNVLTLSEYYEQDSVVQLLLNRILGIQKVLQHRRKRSLTCDHKLPTIEKRNEVRG